MGRGRAVWRVFPDPLRREVALEEETLHFGSVDASRWLTLPELFAKLAESPLPDREDDCARKSLAVVLAVGSTSEAGAAERAAMYQLEQSGVSPALFKHAAESLNGSVQHRALVLAETFTRYAQRCERHGLGGEAQRLERAREVLQESDLPATFHPGDVIHLRVTEALTPLELGTLLELARACEREEVMLWVEVAAVGLPAADLALEKVFQAFEREAQTLQFVELSVPPGRDRPEKIQVLAGRTPLDEAAQVAAHVEGLLRQGVSPTNIAVGIFDPEDEARIARLFPHARRTLATLGRGSLARRAAALLRLEEGSFPVEPVAALLEERSGDGPAAAVLLTDAQVRDDSWGSPEGKGAYALRLHALADRLEQKGKQRRAGAVRALQARCEKLLTAVRAWPRSGAAGDMVRGAKNLIESWAVQRRDAPVEVRAIAASLQRSMMLLDAHGLTQTRLLRPQLISWLEAQWSEASLDLPAARGVEILDARRLAGRSIPHLVLVGISQGTFGQAAALPAVLNEAARASLRDAVGRDLFPTAFAESRRHLEWHQALQSATESLTVSFAQTGWGQELQGPSDEVVQLAAAANIEIPTASTALGEPTASTALGDPWRAPNEHSLRVAAARSIKLGSEEVAEVLGREEWVRRAQSLAAIEAERLRFFSDPAALPGTFSGRIAPTTVLGEALRYGPDRPLSASSLARWGNCAFQGLLTSVLRLERRELPTEDADARSRGVFLHRVLERLLASGQPLDQALAEVAAEVEAQGLTGHPTLWKLEQESARLMLSRLLATGALYPYEGFRPQATELAFGRDGSPAGWETIRLPGLDGESDVHFEGKIDRLDGSAGDIAVLDYKSGGSRSAGDLARALLVTEFQLPIYLYAARIAGHAQARRAAWIALRTGDTQTLDAVLEKTGQTVDGLLAADGAARKAASDSELPNLANAVHRLLTPVRAGLFPIRSLDCARCGMEAVCRVTQRRGEAAP